MKVIVGEHKCTIDKTPVNELEVNVTKVEFEFDEKIPAGYVKKAFFTQGDISKEVLLVNDECNIPNEVLYQKGQVRLGVIAYEVQDEELIERFNPTPAYFQVWEGSLTEADNTEPITPTDKEQIEQALQNGLNDIAEAVENAGKLDIDVEKVGKVATVTITKQDGTQKQEQIEDGEDGVSLENIKIENKDLIVTYGGNDDNLGQVAPSIQIGTTTTGLPNTQASVENVGTSLNPILNFTIPKGEAGAIKMLIVAELPQTGADDTIYLVPLENPDVQGNNYAEYVYINGAWELLGKIGVQVDLTDYYTKTETNDLLSNKVGFTDYATQSNAGIVKGSNAYAVGFDGANIRSVTNTYEQYQSRADTMFVSKGTLENVITGKDLTTNAYVDGLVGDIGTILDSINNEVL